MRACAYKRPRECTHVRACTRTHTHTHTRARARARARAHTHTHTHTHIKKQHSTYKLTRTMGLRERDRRVDAGRAQGEGGGGGGRCFITVKYVKTRMVETGEGVAQLRRGVLGVGRGWIQGSEFTDIDRLLTVVVPRWVSKVSQVLLVGWLLNVPATC